MLTPVPMLCPRNICFLATPLVAIASFLRITYAILKFP